MSPAVRAFGIAFWAVMRRWLILAGAACLALLNSQWQEWLTKALAELEKHPQAAIIGPIILYGIEFAQKWWREQKKLKAAGSR